MAPEYLQPTSSGLSSFPDFNFCCCGIMGMVVYNFHHIFILYMDSTSAPTSLLESIKHGGLICATYQLHKWNHHAKTLVFHVCYKECCVRHCQNYPNTQAVRKWMIKFHDRSVFIKIFWGLFLVTPLVILRTHCSGNFTLTIKVD